MQATGMDTLLAYNRNGSTDLPFTAAIIDRYERDVPELLGIVNNYESSSQASFIDGMPVANADGGKQPVQQPEPACAGSPRHGMAQRRCSWRRGLTRGA
jgi:hypothetical protein